MSINITTEVAALERLTVPQLWARYAELFGEATHTHHKPALVRRIAWRLQALAEGDLSERARQRAAELAHDADLRLAPPRVPPPPTPAPAEPGAYSPTDARLPPPGTVLTRRYKGQLLQVEVLRDGFAYQGAAYRSLSAVAKAITGSHCNGFLFFRMGHPGEPR